MQLPSYPLTHLSLARLAASWPAEAPLICLGGSGRFAIIALSWREVGWTEVAQRTVAVPAADGTTAAGLPFLTGYIGLIPYDCYAPRAPLDQPAEPRVFRVEQALVHDREAGVLYVTGAPADTPGYTTVEAAKVLPLLLAAGALDQPAPPVAPLPLTASGSDAAYEAQVASVLGEIRDGRFYQLNLLRYFAVAAAPSRQWTGARLDRYGGDFSAWFDLPGLMVASFSPERFVRCRPVGQETVIEAFPIKGTAPRHLGDEALDVASGIALEHSEKDRAELHMIIDLMRHDLYAASLPGSVRVVHAGRLLRLASVYHLEAEVAAVLRPGLTIGALLAAVCPGGSITGAPKKEVMAAIRAYEGRPRGYFMGHTFYAADHGYFDTSILIRTLVQQPGLGCTFAAGSGLVIGSDPASERDEIAAKCRVLTLD